MSDTDEREQTDMVLDEMIGHISEFWHISEFNPFKARWSTHLRPFAERLARAEAEVGRLGRRYASITDAARRAGLRELEKEEANSLTDHERVERLERALVAVGNALSAHSKGEQHGLPIGNPARASGSLGEIARDLAARSKP